MDASYKEYRDHVRPRVKDKYKILGFISSGTYGRVYKAMPKGASDMTNKDRQQPLYAIKKFKADAQQNTSHSAFSQSAIREILVGLLTRVTTLWVPGDGAAVGPVDDAP